MTSNEPDSPTPEKPVARPAPDTGVIGVRTIAPSPGAAERESGEDRAAARLGMVLQLADRLRQASPDEYPFILVNETRQLIPYRQAAFWRMRNGKPVMEAMSGLAVVDKNSPFVTWSTRLAAYLLERSGGQTGGSEALSLAALEQEEKAPAWLAEWREWLPAHAVFSVLYGPGGWVYGCLCLVRETPFRRGEAGLFGQVSASYGDIAGGNAMRRRRSGRVFGWWRIAGLVALIALACLMALPRPRTVLAQAEVTPRRPAIVRAGVDGVIQEFLVAPNERVSRGQPLFRLEDTQLRTRLVVAEKAEEMARAEYRQLQQAALQDAKSKARLPLVEGRTEQLAAETRYIRSLLDRVVAASPMDGIVLLNNPDDWIGRPVSLGQKILTVANPADVSLEINIPVADAVPLREGNSLLFFPNVNPTGPVRASVSYAGYRAVETPGMGMTFRVRAEFHDDGREPPMLGLRGTARLEGRSMPLGAIILRKPLMAVRIWLGW